MASAAWGGVTRLAVLLHAKVLEACMWQRFLDCRLLQSCCIFYVRGRLSARYIAAFMHLQIDNLIVKRVSIAHMDVV